MEINLFNSNFLYGSINTSHSSQILNKNKKKRKN